MNLDNNYSVYSHTNKLNNKKYIGQTKQLPLYRWGKNGNGYKTQIFYRAILKYGWENFEHTIIAENLTKEEADSLERELIEKYQTTNPLFGYNIEKGGNDTWYPTGKNHPNARSVICLETHKLFDTIKDAEEWLGVKIGKSHIHESCIGSRKTAGKHPITKQSLHWLYKEDYTEELAEYRINQKNLPDPKIKQIKCITNGKIFSSMVEAQKYAGLCSKSGICLCCQGKRKFAGKDPITGERLQWCYVQKDSL